MTLSARFPGTCARCGKRFAAGTAIEWAKGGKATHATASACATAAVPVAPTPVDVGSFASVVALFETAKAHLKFPKVTLLVAGKTVTLSLAGAKSKTPGSVTLSGEGTYPAREWFGRVSPEGAWTPGRTTPEFLTALTTVLTAFGADPAAVAKEHGRLTGHCCFCQKALTDEGSVELGYGPVCAKHWHLPHKAKGTKALAELVTA